MAGKSTGKSTAKSNGKAKAKGKTVAKAKPAKVVKVAKAPATKTAVKLKEITKGKEALKKAMPKLIPSKPPQPTPEPVTQAAAAKPSRARKITVSASASEASSALAAKWANLFKKSAQIEAKPYNMKAAFEEKTAIIHKVLGWGYILANRNDRLEVLFKDGIKYLISNYKA